MHNQEARHRIVLLAKEKTSVFAFLRFERFKPEQAFRRIAIEEGLTLQLTRSNQMSQMHVADASKSDSSVLRN